MEKEIYCPMQRVELSPDWCDYAQCIELCPTQCKYNKQRVESKYQAEVRASAGFEQVGKIIKRTLAAI